MQRWHVVGMSSCWHVVQHELLPELRHEIELTPKLERLVHTLEWARVEEFCSSKYAGVPSA
jgi:hypothetical protein